MLGELGNDSDAARAAGIPLIIMRCSYPPSAARNSCTPCLTSESFPPFSQIMRPKRARSRKIARIANSRWIAYGTAGAATALGATTAEADIHYSGIINEPVSFGAETFPLSNGAVLWFEHHQTDTNYNSAKFELRSAAVSNGWQSDFNGFRYVPMNLARNQPISTQHFGDGVGILASSPFCNGYQFCGRGSAILGFKFNTGGGTQYGWARLKMNGYERQNEFYVVEYAWADPGEDIRTGQRHSFSQQQGAVFPSGSLGLLALGKAGLELWRAQRLSSVTGK